MEPTMTTDDADTLPEVTDAQLDAIRARAVNDATREIMQDGVLLTHAEADDLGDEAIDWIGGRLGLNVTDTEDGVECRPPAHHVGRDEDGELVTPEDCV